jgi:hypothetical protein
MSALLAPPRGRGSRERRHPEPAGADLQESLFGALPAAPPAPRSVPPAAAVTVAAPAPPAAVEPEPIVAPEPAPTASAHRHGPTLDDLVAGAWEGLLAGAPAACPVCATALRPRHSAGAGVVGGRCTGCGSTLS